MEEESRQVEILSDNIKNKFESYKFEQIMTKLNLGEVRGSY